MTARTPTRVTLRNFVDDPREASELRAAAISCARALAGGGRVWGWSRSPVRLGEPLLTLRLPDAPWPALALARETLAPGDVLVMLAPGDDALAANLALRCQAWGVRVAWLGEGVRVGSAHQVLSGDDPQRLVDSVLERYRQCCENAETLALAIAEKPETDVCITCSDEGRLAEVLTLDSGPLGQAHVRTEASLSEPVDLMLTPEARVFDLVLVHAGLAITQVAAPPLTHHQESE
ncbi:hypothetical protein JT358_08230 [Micrococcales bacterium 31B]|nr:hypothetical protein [Micrococcales bacterium 31B]